MCCWCFSLLRPRLPSSVAVKDGNPAVAELENMILECAKLDREINYFVDIVQQVTEEVGATWHDLIIKIVKH